MADWGLADWGFNEWIGAGSAALALVSVVLNWLIVRRQTWLQFEGLKAKADAEMMEWANHAIDTVSEGVALARGRGVAYGDAELRPRLIEVSARLSSLADRGRLFFPNQEHADHGQEKEAAFRGFRPVILDAVIFGHYQLDRIDPQGAAPDAAAGEYLVKCRRLLVSEVQDAVDPRRRGAMMAQLAKGVTRTGQSSFATVSALAQDLRARFPDGKIAERGPEWIARREKAARGG